MKAMDSEKVAKFLAYLEGEEKHQWEERSAFKGEGNDELAYHCKMRASQTEAIKYVFMKLLNEDESPEVGQKKHT